MFGKSSTSKKIIAVADVGSGSVGVALLAIHAGAPATVIASNRVALAFEERSEDATARGIIGLLSEASERTLAAYTASGYKNSSIKTIYAVMRAPWTRSKTERASSSTGTDVRITNAMISALAQQAIANDKELDHERLIESAAIRVELNGYATAFPVGKSARALSVVTLMSDCDTALKTGVEETLRRIFPGAMLTLRSGARSLIRAAEDQSTIGKDYVILDIEGEASTIIVVREGLPTEHLLIPEGVRSIIGRISDKGMPEETLSLLRMMERNESTNDAAGSLSASVARVEIDLARVYGEGFTKIAAVLRLPPELLLVTHPDLSPWLTTFFSRIDFSQCTLTAQPFTVISLTAQDFRGVVASGESPTIDIGLSVASALVNSEEQL